MTEGMICGPPLLTTLRFGLFLFPFVFTKGIPTLEQFTQKRKREYREGFRANHPLT